MTVTRQYYRGRPRTSRSPGVNGDAGCTPSICYKLQADAIRGCEPRSDRTMCRWCTHTPLGSGAPGQRPSSQRCADTFHVPTRSDPQLAGSPAGANRPAEAALCPESRARISSHHPKYAGFGDSVRCAGQYQDGLRRSDATDRSPLHSGTCVSVCVCVQVRVCACVCVCARACLTDENRALRALSTHKPPASSKHAQTACSLSRGEAPEAKVGTRRRPFSVALARTWHVGQL